jgi:hypothetical protein
MKKKGGIGLADGNRVCATAAIAPNWGGWGGCLGFFVHLFSLGIFVSTLCNIVIFYYETKL